MLKSQLGQYFWDGGSRIDRLYKDVVLLPKVLRCVDTSLTSYVNPLSKFQQPSHAKESQQVAMRKVLDQFLHTTVRTRIDQQQGESQDSRSHFTIVRVILAGCLSFAAASISSAGGIGGGGLFVPILIVVAGLDLKTAISFSALMATGCSVANVINSMPKKYGDKPLIDFDIALLSEPCYLLGVSVGVICNISFPEWLITILFVFVLGWSTYKTFKSGVNHWKLESQGIRRGTSEGQTWRELDAPWSKLAVLAMIWFSFCLLFLLRGNRSKRGFIHLKSCGVGYWIISAVQVPLAIIMTLSILCARGSLRNQQELDTVINEKEPHKIIFPPMGFVAGAFGGTFGIGGGMLTGPLLLQVGTPPTVTTATSSFMVFFASSMSAFQYILHGMEHIEAAVALSVACFVGSAIGLEIIQRAIQKYGRPSLVVFSLGLVLALSTVLMPTIEGIRVWHDYRNGNYMGFKQPC